MKPHLSGFAVVVAALIVVCVALSFGKARFASLKQMENPDQLPDKHGTQITGPPAGFAPQKDAVSAPVRQIQPKIFAPPDMRDAASPERIAPRAPLTPPPVRVAEPAGTVIAARSVLVPDGGTLVLGKQTMALAGIVPLAPGEICHDANGSQWPCGMAARTALRGYLRNRLVRCVRDPVLTETMKAVCRACRQL